DTETVAGEPVNLPSGCHLPDLNDLVFASRRQESPVRGKGDRGHFPQGTVQPAQLLAGRNLPQPKGAVVAGRSEHLAVRGKGQVRGEVAMPEARGADARDRPGRQWVAQKVGTGRRLGEQIRPPKKSQAAGKVHYGAKRDHRPSRSREQKKASRQR